MTLLYMGLPSHMLSTVVTLLLLTVAGLWIRLLVWLWKDRRAD